MTDQSVYYEIEPGRITQRTDSDGTYEVKHPDTVHLSGYVCGFGECERYGGPDAGGWIERIERNAFVQAIADDPDMGLLFNFEGLPVARTKSGSLQLAVDGTGLHVKATLLTDEPRVQHLLDYGHDGILRDMQWGFSFRVTDQDQEFSEAPGYGDATYRSITKLSLLDAGIVKVPVHAR